MAGILSLADSSNGSSLRDSSYGSGSMKDSDAGVGKRAITVTDAVVVGMNSVSSGSGENSLPTVSSVTYEDVGNLCDCSECQSG